MILLQKIIFLKFLTNLIFANQNLLEKEEYSVNKFREYIRIKTDNPNPNYEPAIKLLESLCKEIGLNFNILRFDESKNFAIYCSWNCSEPKLKSIMMNSHVDVVPASAEKWTYPPYEAYKDSNGNIYGRGAQDSKSKGIQYLFAIKQLIDMKYKPKRCVHVTFVSNEEILGGGGMKPFTQSKKFQNLNIGAVIEEATPFGDKYTVFYADKVSWKIKMTAFGPSGHGSNLPEKTAVSKIIRVANKMMAIRDSEIKILKRRKLLSGDVNSINLNKFECGDELNVIPSKCSAIFDCRLTPIRPKNMAIFEAKINNISKEEGIEVSYLEKTQEISITKLDTNNIWWMAFKSAFDFMNETLNTAIFPARSDAMYTRKLGLPVFEFAAMTGISLAHADNEYINEGDFLNGIGIYKNILVKMTSLAIAQND